MEIGLGALYKISSSAPPTVETRALIKKLTNLRNKIGSWNDTTSISEFDVESIRRVPPAVPYRLIFNILIIYERKFLRQVKAFKYLFPDS